MDSGLEAYLGNLLGKQGGKFTHVLGCFEAAAIIIVFEGKLTFCHHGAPVAIPVLFIAPPVDFLNDPAHTIALVRCVCVFVVLDEVADKGKESILVASNICDIKLC